MENKCVVLCGGGTGGHIYPNLALFPDLSKVRRVCYIGSSGGLEEKLCREKGIEFFGINPPKFKRKFTLENAKLPFALAKSKKEASDIIKKLNPVVIFSKGGYVSLPVCLAGISAGIPVLCHESDLTVGLANKITRLRGGTLLTSFPETLKGEKRVIHTGAPIRSELSRKQKALQQSPVNVREVISKNVVATPKLKKLLIIGGSQGAKTINDAVIASLPKLATKFDITHLTGIGKITPKSEILRQFGHLQKSAIETTLSRYHAVEYCTDMKSLYESADIAISRGGANALFELLESEIPTLVIPLEKNSRGDQIENAEYFAKRKLCHTLSENHIFGFFESVENLANNATQIKENIQKAKTNTTFDGRENIVKLILSH
ncbi:MAG: UDP-N-acetylglucosamine--N-acetylmuramyl-(pentapeptide) pyrophosphoryl-undecaprenol N-acetylglucosamine transferase [Bacillota bacterium]